MNEISLIGTKIGGRITVNGGLWRGYNFNAGEIGHISISTDGPVCTCENIGCLVMFFSKNNILQMVVDGLQKGEPWDPGGVY